MPELTSSSAWPAPALPNVPSPPACRTAEDDGGRHRHQRRLDEQPRRRLDPDQLLHHAVQAEAGRQGQRDPGRTAVVDGEHGDRDGRDAHRRPLQRPQPLAEDDHAEQHAHQRVDEVAQRGLDDLPGVDAVDEDQPVDGDEHGGAGEHEQPCAGRRPGRRTWRPARGGRSAAGRRTAATRAPGAPRSPGRRPARGAGSRGGTVPTARRRRARRALPGDARPRPHRTRRTLSSPPLASSQRCPGPGLTGSGCSRPAAGALPRARPAGP